MPRVTDRIRYEKALNTAGKELVKQVVDYYSQYRQPIPMRALSACFRNRFQAWRSTFNEQIQRLESERLIRVRFNKQGFRVVYPGLTAWDSAA